MIDRHGDYHYEQGKPGRHLTTAEGKPRPRYTAEEIHDRMARVSLAQAMQRGEIPQTVQPIAPQEQASEPEVDSDDWETRAECKRTDPEAFFPEKGGSTSEAKKVCLRCDVQAICLEHALANDIQFGVWGGLSERERRKLKKRTV